MTYQPTQYATHHPTRARPLLSPSTVPTRLSPHHVELLAPLLFTPQIRRQPLA